MVIDKNPMKIKIDGDSLDESGFNVEIYALLQSFWKWQSNYCDERYECDFTGWHSIVDDVVVKMYVGCMDRLIFPVFVGEPVFTNGTKWLRHDAHFYVRVRWSVEPDEMGYGGEVEVLGWMTKESIETYGREILFPMNYLFASFGECNDDAEYDENHPSREWFGEEEFMMTRCGYCGDRLKNICSCSQVKDDTEWFQGFRSVYGEYKSGCLLVYDLFYDDIIFP